MNVRALLLTVACSETFIVVGIALGCLNPDNIRLRPTRGQVEVKVTGFEASQACRGTQCLIHRLATSAYTAPEVRESTYTTCADVWSFGGIVYRLLSGLAPSHSPRGKVHCLQIS